MEERAPRDRRDFTRTFLEVLDTAPMSFSLKRGHVFETNSKHDYDASLSSTLHVPFTQSTSYSHLLYASSCHGFFGYRAPRSLYTLSTVSSRCSQLGRSSQLLPSAVGGCTLCTACRSSRM